MDYTSIHIYGHLLSDDILHNIERDNTLNGNRDQDFGMDISVSSAIDYVWSSLRNDWNFYKERANNERLVNKDPYGTRRARDLMERLFQSLGYSLDRQATNIEVAGTNYDISYTCHDLGKMPFIIIGEGISADGSIDTLASVHSTIVPKAVCARSRLMPLCSNISTPQRMYMASSATDKSCESSATPDSW